MTDLDLDPGARRVEPGRIISEVFRIYREQAGVLLPVVVPVVVPVVPCAAVVPSVALVIRPWCHRPRRGRTPR